MMGTKGIMAGPEGTNLRNQAINELTTQVVNAPFQHGYDADSLVKIFFNQDHITVIETKTAKITYQLSPDIEGRNHVYWESQDPDVATVDQNGIVTGVKVGDTVVTATTETGVQAKCYVHVDPLVRLSINPTQYEIYVGDTCQIQYTITPENALNKHIEWRSSSTEIASVDSSGLITGVSPGSTTIIGTTSSGDTASCTVNVKKRPPPDYMWTSRHYGEDTKHVESESSFEEGQSGGGKFTHKKNAGGDADDPTVHDIYTFNTPTLFKAGTVFRFICREYRAVDKEIYINGNRISIRFDDADDYYYGDLTSEATYVLQSDTYLSNIEFRGYIGGSLDELHEYGVYIFVTPPEKNTFCLNSSGTSNNQNYSNTYFIGSMDEDDDGDYYIGRNDFVFESPHVEFNIHFAGPKSISYVDFGDIEESRFSKEYDLEVTDMNGNNDGNSVELAGHEKSDVIFNAKDFGNADASKITDLRIHVTNAWNDDSVVIYPVVHFTDGTTLALGTGTAMPVWHYWD